MRVPRHPHFPGPVIAQAGLPAELADALEDTSSDAGIRQETGEALALTGKDAGTPIIQFQLPAGVAFFGPVISRLPTEAEAVALWDTMPGLASRRAQAQRARATATWQLRCEPGQAGAGEDWNAGSRRAPE